MRFIENIRDIAKKVGDKVLGIFDRGKLNDLARETGFIQRSTSRMEGEDFARLMSTEIMGEEPATSEALCDIARQINPDADMTSQAMNERLNKKESAVFLKEVLESALAENLSPVKSEISPEPLSPFGRVFVQDGTQIILHEKLADDFPGSGGSASRSALKIDLIYEVKQDALHRLLISGGKIPDQTRADIRSEMRENDLILRDLGYFTVPSLRGIAEKDAFFLSRLLKGVNVYFSGDRDAKSVNIPKYLDKNFSHLTVSDMSVWLGEEERMPCRLIAYRLPDEVVAERRGKAERNARKKGRQPTKEYLNWLRFGFYVTNVPPEIWEPEVIGTIYRLRWQIELTFKHWKSLMNVHVIKGTRPERVRCFLYGRLISVVVVTMISGYASWYAYKHLKKEASFHKIISWLKRKGRLATAIGDGSLDELFDELREIMSKSLCKQKRTRKTTRQLLEERVPYMDGFPDDKAENRNDNIILFRKPDSEAENDNNSPILFQKAA